MASEDRVQLASGFGRVVVEDRTRSPRALGRGFEEISDLFLPAAAAPTPPERAEDQPPELPGARPAPRAGVAVLRPGVALGKDQLTATLAECQDALEPGLRILGAAVPCSPHTEIDVLAVDRRNRLTIVDVETTLDDRLLLRGIGHVDWAVCNLANLGRMYPACAIDAGLQPRLMLVAPAFSQLHASALRQLTGPAVRCFIYHTVVVSDRPGIFIEPAS